MKMLPNERFISITTLPDYIKLFAKYEDDGEVLYVRVGLAGLTNEGNIYPFAIDCDGYIGRADDADNFIGYERPDRGWISEEEFINEGNLSKDTLT